MKYSYKVVRESRRGFRSWNNRLPRKFNLKYEGIVEAPKGSLGIFCFKRLKDAISFSYASPILRVKPLSKGKVPKKIVHFNFINEISKMINGKNFVPSHTYPGSICYEKIEIINKVSKKIYF